MTVSGQIDSHAHLCDPAFDDDLHEVLARARSAGVEHVVAVGETLDDAQANLALAERYPGTVLPAAGLYPTHLDLEQAAQIEDFVRQHRRRLIAIGEVGLDRWKVQDEEELALQKQIFERMVDLAMEVDLPLNIHSRAAGRHVIEVLLEKGATRVQLHAFDGKYSKALPGIEAGFHFSVPPSIERSPQKQKLFRHVPDELLLLETDSPVLGPQKDKRNEPRNVLRALRALAELRETTPERLGAIIRRNALKFFGLN